MWRFCGDNPTCTPPISFVLVRACPRKPSLCSSYAMPCDNLPVLGVAQQIASKGVYCFFKISISFASVAVTPLLISAFAQTLTQGIRANRVQVTARHSKAHHTSKLMRLSRVNPTSLGTIHSCAVEVLGNVVKHGEVLSFVPFLTTNITRLGTGINLQSGITIFPQSDIFMGQVPNCREGVTARLHLCSGYAS